jgi:hypothetical protein
MSQAICFYEVFHPIFCMHVSFAYATCDPWFNHRTNTSEKYKVWILSHQKPLSYKCIAVTYSAFLTYYFLFSCTVIAHEICISLSSVVIYNVKTQNEWSYYYLHEDVTCLLACGPPVTLPCHTTHADSLLFGLCHHLFIFDTGILLGNCPSSLGLGLPAFHVPSGSCEIVSFSHSYLIHSDHMTQPFQPPLKKLQEIFIVHPTS